MPFRSALPRRLLPAVLWAALFVIVAAIAPPALSGAIDSKPSINVRASPAVGFAPARVVLTAELKGGPDDYQEFYCATVEWDITAVNGIGDGNKSEQKLECDPYEPGKSEIRRRYTRDQVFKTAGEYRVQFNLKQKNKVVGSGRTTIRIRPGVGDGMDIR